MAKNRNYFVHIEGLPGHFEPNEFILEINESELYIRQVRIKSFSKYDVVLSTFKIPLGNILAMEKVSEKEVSKSKSVIGRGIAGGVLFGPAGLVLGGMSGIGKKKESFACLAISYLSETGEKEPKIIIFQDFLRSGVSANDSYIRELRQKFANALPSDLVKEYLENNPVGIKNSDGSMTL